MYDKPFYITESVSNNRFSFEKRIHKRLYVPALIEGRFKDVKPGEEIVFEEYDGNGVLRSCKGLKYFVRITGKGKPVYIFDNHNHAFAFWHLERIRGRVREGSLLIHMDQHKDSRKPEKFLSAADARDAEKVFDYTNTILNVGNFIPAAIETGLVKNAVNINGNDALNDFDFSLFDNGCTILDIDMDFFAPEMDYIDTALKLDYIKKVGPKADMVTISTSPFFIDHKLAFSLLGKIATILDFT